MAPEAIANNATTEKMDIPKTFDFQGHRGCRGLMPENSIEGFIKALDLGVSTLEMDVVVTSDNEVLVSHDPFFSHEICTDPSGKAISEKDERNTPIYSLTFAETQQYDCGSIAHPRFPDQQKFTVRKPLLSKVIDAAENHSRERGRKPPRYNIETKSTPQGDGTMHPAPSEFSTILAELLIEKNLVDRAIIQSFDVRTLQYFHENYPDFDLALLIENKMSAEKNLEILGFLPEIYSPESILVNKDLVEYCHQRGMKIIPWTVNDPAEMRALIGLDIDGLISDYPDRFSKL